MLGNLSCNVVLAYPTMNVMPSMLPKTHWENFGAWLRKMRRDKDLTQKEVAKRADIHEVQLARIEKGESGTKRETVIALSKAIGVDTLEMLKKAGFTLPDDDTLAQYSEFFLPGSRKPANFIEMLEGLEALGIDIQHYTGDLEKLENASPEDLQEIMEQVAAITGIKIRRIMQRDG